MKIRPDGDEDRFDFIFGQVFRSIGGANTVFLDGFFSAIFPVIEAKDMLRLNPVGQ
jgi:hypothetical protein